MYRPGSVPLHLVLLFLARPKMLVLTLVLSQEPGQVLTFAQVLAAGSVFSRTDRFYPVQQPEQYLLAE